MLSSSKFELITQQYDDEYSYKAYKPKGNPIVLFSEKEHIPLASLHFESFYDIENSSLIASRKDKDEAEPNIQHFQGIINKDNHKIKFTITNLTQHGYINFNILKDNTQIIETNPGGLNQINELRPYESHEVKCDQFDNRAIILTSVVDEKGNKIKVKEIETNPSISKEKGINYYLSVVPQKNTKDTELFKNTYWESVDYFIIKHHLYNTNRHTVVNCSHEEDNDSDSWSVQYGGVNNDRDSPQGALYLCGEDSEEDDSVGMAGGMYGDSSSDDDEVAIHNVKAMAKGVIPHGVKSNTDDEIIKNSNITKIIKGETIDVVGVETNIEYEFEYNSKPCIINLTVNENLLIENNIDKKELETAVKTMIDSKFEVFVSGTIYKTDECVISMEGKPNIVFYTCGHCCVREESIVDHKLTNCPLCRKYISAMIKINE
jgi:hypothetical protein